VHDHGKTAGSCAGDDTKKHPVPLSAAPWHGSEKGVAQDNAVSEALALALERASAAGQWEVVLALAVELKARR
jgi:hypothetical protein